MHSDTETSNLVVSGNAENPESLPIHELLSNYIGDKNLIDATHAISAINKGSGVGPCIQGLIICCCGSTGKLPQSVKLLKHLVEDDIFNFVLMFVGISTLDQVVVPVLNRFIKNVYVYNLKIWDTLEELFGEDRHALNQSREFLSYANMMPDENRVQKCLINTRVLAYSNLKDGQP
ncbi:hypothetical protein BD769DRAFT_1679707 [Suillus cothurnatus]|nr:hypothetical protein BD769DRAFT_1679707 [Suillus cothurnatus]